MNMHNGVTAVAFVATLALGFIGAEAGPLRGGHGLSPGRQPRATDARPRGRGGHPRSGGLRIAAEPPPTAPCYRRMVGSPCAQPGPAIRIELPGRRGPARVVLAEER